MEPAHSSFAEALHAAHIALLSDLRDLDETVRAHAGTGVAELGARLGKTRTHLLDHFRFEEDGGYMAPVLEEEPRFEREVKELLDEHAQMIQRLDALMQEVTATGSLGDLLRSKVHDWIKQVRTHEAHENHLVQEAYYSSGATGD